MSVLTVVCGAVYFGLAQVFYFIFTQGFRRSLSGSLDMNGIVSIRLDGSGKYCTISETLFESSDRLICRFCCVDFATGTFSKESLALTLVLGLPGPFTLFGYPVP